MWTRSFPSKNERISNICFHPKPTSSFSPKNTPNISRNQIAYTICCLRLLARHVANPFSHSASRNVLVIGAAGSFQRRNSFVPLPCASLPRTKTTPSVFPALRLSVRCAAVKRRCLRRCCASHRRPSYHPGATAPQMGASSFTSLGPYSRRCPSDWRHSMSRKKLQLLLAPHPSAPRR